jgi:predicted metal-binding protein
MTNKAEGETVVFVCTSCRGAGNDEIAPGAAVCELLQSRLRDAGVRGVTVKAVECLAVCKRPATISVSAEGSWTYIIGDLDPRVDADGIVETIIAFHRSADGIVPWRERPSVFRKGVIARIPPRGFVQPVKESA